MKRLILSPLGEGEALEVNKDGFVLGKQAGEVDGLLLNNPLISRIHCRILFRKEGCFVEDLDSANGTFVNRHRVPPYTLHPLQQGDLLRLANRTFQVRELALSPLPKRGRLTFSYQSIAMDLDIPGEMTAEALCEKLKEGLGISLDVETLLSCCSAGGEAAFSPETGQLKQRAVSFVRNTRLQGAILETPIGVLDPPAPPQKTEQHPLMTLLPSVVMLVLIVVLRGVLGTTGSTFVIFSACSMGLGVFTSAASLVAGRKKYKNACVKRRRTYEEYVERKRREIEEARRRELSERRARYCSTRQNLDHLLKQDPCLFDRTPEDEDFLDVTLGGGEVEALRRVEVQTRETLEVGDELNAIPKQLAKAYRYLQHGPVVLPLREANAVGIVGTKQAREDFFCVILLDLICRQYAGDVQIHLLLEEKQLPALAWVRHLPHLQQPYGRSIVYDKESRAQCFESLTRELSARQEKPGRRPFQVIFVLEEHALQDHPLARFVEGASKVDAVFLFFAQTHRQLPLYCSRIAELMEGRRGKLLSAKNQAKAATFSYAAVPREELERGIFALGGMSWEALGGGQQLNSKLSLFSLLGVERAEELSLSKRWQSAKIFASMAVPVGRDAKNDIVSLDLQETAHGPHALVAGTTGSGKSELLLTYLLCAATLFSPSELGFVIIDFKGGGLGRQLLGLPHLLGVMTNLEGNDIARSLSSIKAELLKRQRLFAEAGVSQIDKYSLAYREGKVQEPLPHLVLLVDEFAQLKAEQPDFMKELIGAARIGRSLGIHLILATQKPAGQVDEQIWSNSRCRLCLKVQTREDSREVLRSSVAAELTEPGQAYLQVGNNELFTLLQSAYAGAPVSGPKEEEKEVYVISLLGHKRPLVPTLAQKEERCTQGEALLSHIINYCNSHGIQPLAPICLPPLPGKLPYKEGEKADGVGLAAEVGLLDDPAGQTQRPAMLPLGTAHTLIVGAARSGKTNLLSVLVRRLAESYSPQDVWLYLLDFSSMSLSRFGALPHVGGVVTPGQEEALKNLFKFLREQLQLRRERLLLAGAGSFAAYREGGKADLPYIVVLIDNFTALRELAPAEEETLLLLCREGLFAGISLVVANSQTTGLGYKYLTCFSARIALFCNEAGEYATLFGSSRMRIGEIPGRCLFAEENQLFEGQIFEAFSEGQSPGRGTKMQDFLQNMEAAYQNCRAHPIPQMPALLTKEALLLEAKEKGGLAIGLAYETVAPVFLSGQGKNVLALTGAPQRGKTNFFRYVIEEKLDRGCGRVLIFDDFRRRLAPLAHGREEVSYYVGAEQAVAALLSLEEELQAQFDTFAFSPEAKEGALVVLHCEEVYEAISREADALLFLKKLLGKYRPLGTFLLCGALENAPITYSSPEACKLIKEQRSWLIFEELSQCRVMDIPVSAIRSNRQKMPPGDAFFLTGSECIRLKTPRVT